ncbi:hypothetical protein Dimus_025627 [Dionaea muscipula]
MNLFEFAIAAEGKALPPTKMIILPLFLLLFLFLRPFSNAAAGLNDSFIIHSTSAAPVESDSDNPQTHPSPFLLKDILKAIAAKQKWDYERIRVSRIEKPRVLHPHKYEFLVRFDKRDLLISFHEKLDGWRRFVEERNLEDLVSGVSSNAVLSPLQLEGPLELLVAGDDRLHLQLPLNTSVAGLRTIHVREGITVEIIGAQEVSLVHSISSHQSDGNRDKNPFWLVQHCICSQLRPIRVLGSASIIAYRSRNPASAIDANILSRTIIELKRAICYPNSIHKGKSFPIGSFLPPIAVVEELLKRLSLVRTTTTQQQDQNGTTTSFLQAKIKPSTMARFRLDLEVDATTDDSTTPTRWRTPPDVERESFDVVARVETGRLLPFVVKNARTFDVADSIAWSSLLSNISFTKFRNLLVPPRMLTLDVKW